ncbi:hypothetical protein NUM3379_34320 [Kineococcus sp. NUM-3379]
MRLHAIYRSHGGENSKNRPGWYSKLSCLQSFCRAVEVARGEGEVDVVFLNDGPLPAERLEVMEAWGSTVPITAGSNRRSYLRGLALPRERAWDAADLVLLAEDDYLWAPGALGGLGEGAGGTWGDYFTPYWSSRYPPAGTDGPAGYGWVPCVSTTSTFAARAGTLREDERLLTLCSLSGGDFDHTSCLTLQGIPRFGPLDLVRHHAAAEGTDPARRLARSVYLTAMKAAVDVRALRRPSRRRVLLAPRVPLATHAEAGWLAPGDWEGVARQTAAWAGDVAPTG